MKRHILVASARKVDHHCIKATGNWISCRILSGLKIILLISGQTGAHTQLQVYRFLEKQEIIFLKEKFFDDSCIMTVSIEKKMFCRSICINHFYTSHLLWKEILYEYAVENN